MPKKPDKRHNLSEPAQRVVYLIETLASGSRRKFATLANCSHSAIAKIANGKQVPGAKLLERIGEIDGVSHDWLMNGTGEPLLPGAKSDRDSRVPIAESLLPGLPTDNNDLLTGKFIEMPLPRPFYRKSLYAIEANRCQPAFGSDSELGATDDLVIVDTDQAIWNDNVRTLDGMLCVTKDTIRRQGTLSMRRLWVETQNQSGKKFRIMAVSDDSLANWQQEKQRQSNAKKNFGKELRNIQIESSSGNAIKDKFRMDIPIGSVVGRVVLQLRYPKSIGFFE